MESLQELKYFHLMKSRCTDDIIAEKTHTVSAVPEDRFKVNGF